MLNKITCCGHTIQDGELKNLVFLFGNAYYKVVFNEDNLELYNSTHTIHNKSKLVAKLDYESDYPVWMLDHCCGLQGFGRSLDDVCYGCKHETGLESKSDNISSLIMGGNYSKKLENVLMEMPEYKHEFEKTLKNL